MRLIINLATRGRAAVCRETVLATVPNIDLPSTIFVVSADNDDVDTVKALIDLPKRVHVWAAQREDNLGAKYNRVVGTGDAGDVYMVMVDYAPCVTPGFDQIILEQARKFRDGIGVIMGPLANLSFPCMQAVTHQWAKLAGGIYPERFPFHFIDHWLDDLARMTGRFTYADIKVDYETRRPSRTLELRDVAFWTTYFDMLRGVRMDKAKHILERTLNPPWINDILIAAMPLQEQRSLLLHQHARMLAPQLEASRGAGAPDERYKGIKQRAIDEMRLLVGDVRVTGQSEAAE